MSRDYRIAGLRIRFHEPCADIAAAGVPSFSRFEAEADGSAECVAEFRLDCDLSVEGCEAEILHRFDFRDAACDCFFGRWSQGWIFYMRPYGCVDTLHDTIFIKRFDSTLITSNIAAGRKPDATLLRFGLWMMFGLAALRHGAVAVHSSVIVRDGGAVMFLGESGTGKSTHTRLWRRHIEGAWLLNDDSPIVRIDEGRAVVCGSPWSGKTPCYIDRCCPIRGVVRLSQAPCNRISRLPLLHAFGALYPSCPPSFGYDAELQDGVCDIISGIIESVGVWHLECLPDEEAARLACGTVFGEESCDR